MANYLVTKTIVSNYYLAKDVLDKGTSGMYVRLVETSKKEERCQQN